MKTEIRSLKILIAFHSADGYCVKNQFAGNWVSGNFEILPNRPDQARALQLAILNVVFNEPRIEGHSELFSGNAQGTSYVLLESLRQMTAVFSG